MSTPNNGIAAWRRELGEGLRLAREQKGESRKAIAKLLGKKDEEIIRQYELGISVPPLDVLRVLVPHLGADFRVDGCRISSETIPQMPPGPPAEQLRFEYSYKRAVVSIKATDRELVVRARAAE